MILRGLGGEQKGAGRSRRLERIVFVGADGGSRTRTGSPPQDFKSFGSSSSTTSARCSHREATVPEILTPGNAIQRDILGSQVVLWEGALIALGLHCLAALSQSSVQT